MRLRLGRAAISVVGGVCVSVALRCLTPRFPLSFTHISLLTEVLTVINLAAIFYNTVHLFELSIAPNENTITI